MACGLNPIACSGGQSCSLPGQVPSTDTVGSTTCRCAGDTASCYGAIENSYYDPQSGACLCADTQANAFLGPCAAGNTVECSRIDIQSFHYDSQYGCVCYGGFASFPGCDVPSNLDCYNGQGAVFNSGLGYCACFDGSIPDSTASPACPRVRKFNGMFISSEYKCTLRNSNRFNLFWCFHCNSPRTLRSAN